ncbi:MAG: hypothetical protein HQ488_04470 [Parcubacteria group bacterium]|nr:hypothetical protein [Parcubacteria group bacterium]
MFTLAFKILVFQRGELSQVIENHQVTFDSPEALAEAMIVLAALGTGMTDSVPVIGEISLRTRCAHILPFKMIDGGICSYTRIVIESAEPVTPTVPEGLHELDGQTAIVAAMALNSERRDRVISLTRGFFS